MLMHGKPCLIPIVINNWGWVKRVINARSPRRRFCHQAILNKMNTISNTNRKRTKMTIRINHNRSIAMQRSVINNWGVKLVISSQSLNLGGRRGTSDDVATIPFQSAALRESPNHIPVHSLMLSFHLFFCLPLFLAPFTVPCRIVFAMPEDLEMWPYHPSFRFFTMVKRSSCTPIAFWILLRTSSFVTWSL